jgi:hypothetical protein
MDLDFHYFDRGSHYGLEILLLGWGGGNNGVPWSANVFLAFGLVCLWGQWLRAAVVFGAIASVLGLTTWWVCRYDTLMVGYYVWQASQLVLVGGTIGAIRRFASQRAAVALPPLADALLQSDAGEAA